MRSEVSGQRLIGPNVFSLGSLISLQCLRDQGKSPDPRPVGGGVGMGLVIKPSRADGRLEMRHHYGIAPDMSGGRMGHAKA